MTAITPSASKPFVPTYCSSPAPDNASAAAGVASAAFAAAVPPEFYVTAGMAIVIADSTCRSDIECECALVVVGGQEWFDTDAPALAYAAANAEESRQWIDRALRYFTLRGDEGTGFRVIRNSAFPHLVRFHAVQHQEASDV